MTVPNAPIWVTPSQPGQLSNKRGANTGADALALTVKYVNPRSTGDPAGTVRFVATKPSAGGGAAGVAMDTWWMGAGTGNALPTAGRVRSSFIYRGRCYILLVLAAGTVTRIYSALVNGQSFGVWRQENFLGQTPLADSPYTGFSMATANNFVYLTATIGTNLASTMFYAPLNGDGTIGTFNSLPIVLNDPGYSANRMLFTYSDNLGNSYLITFASNTTQCTSAKVNADGTISKWNAGVAMPTNRANCGIWWAGNGDGSGSAYLIGGYDGTGPRSDIVRLDVLMGTDGTPLITQTATLGTGIPAARAWAGFAIVPTSTAGVYTLYLVGGQATGTTDTGTGTTTIYRIASNLIGTNAWTTDATVLGAAVSGCSCAVTSEGFGLAGNPLFYIIGGQTAGTSVTTILIAKLAVGGTSTSSVLAVTVGAALASGDLGTGGVVTNNQDGSVTITYVWQTSPIGGAALVDGDVVTLSVFVTDQQGGDVSLVSFTSLKIGQPPTISAISPSGATTNRQPTVLFSFTAGAGGGNEAKYQIQIKDNGGNVVADTGLIAGQANSFSPRLYPMLASGLAASTVITAYSSDIPVSGSLASVTATTAFTPTLAAPVLPTTTSLAVDNVGGSVIATWTNPGGSVATFNRLYWRLTGSTTWLAAKDLIVAVIGSAQSFTLMDTIPLGISVDVAVSALAGATPGTGESALVSCGTGTIIPDYHQDLGGYTAMIHVVGNGPNQRVPLPNQPPISILRHVDSNITVMFGGTAPAMRYGVYNFREITISGLPLNSQIATLDALYAAAQAGSILCYRDMMGQLIYCGLPPDRTRKEDLYFAEELKLVETQYTFAA